MLRQLFYILIIATTGNELYLLAQALKQIKRPTENLVFFVLSMR